MSPYLREPSGSTCWNCDRDAEDVVTVTLRMPTRAELVLRLCGRCYDDDFVPLAAGDDDIGAATRTGPTLLDVTREAGRSGPA